MNIDLKTELKDLTGKTILHEGNPLTIGIALAISLSNNQDISDKMRAYVLGTQLYTKESLELNSSDLNFIKESLNTFKGFFPVVSGQLLTILSDKTTNNAD